MFFGNEKINRKSCSEEKKVRGKIVYFYGLESGLSNARRKTFRVTRRFIGRRRGFGKFSEVSTIFSTIFWKISTVFLKFSAIFWKISTIFWKISPKFLQFFQPLRFPYDFSENSCPQSVTVQPGSRHYCKFTIKFTSRITPKFTLILIKILQSTKFEGSHFYRY